MGYLSAQWQYELKHDSSTWGDCDRRLSEWLEGLPDHSEGEVAMNLWNGNVQWKYNKKLMLQVREEWGYYGGEWISKTTRKLRVVYQRTGTS